MTTKAYRYQLAHNIHAIKIIIESYTGSDMLTLVSMERIMMIKSINLPSKLTHTL